MNNQELIQSDLTKKQKSVEAQRKYRQRIKTGTSETSNLTFETYKKQNSEYMKKYRAERKIKTTQAYAESINEQPKITAKKIVTKDVPYDWSQIGENVRKNADEIAKNVTANAKRIGDNVRANSDRVAKNMTAYLNNDRK